MSAIGPDLPPHLLAKRKRPQEDATTDEAATAPGAKPESSLDTVEKRRRVIGPAMPPAPLDERPVEPPEVQVLRREFNGDDSEDDSEDDDDFGPSLPSAGLADNDTKDNADDHKTTLSPRPGAAPSEEKVRRDEWMTMPPTQDDLAARMDPSKIRARGFNTGKGARARAAGDGNDGSSTWHETPEQKRKRLADEVMGVATQAPTQLAPLGKSSGVRSEAEAKKIRENMEKARGPSLIEKHKQGNADAEEDDPSKRAFDREKDMGSGARVSGSQKREMLAKASDYSSRFSGGSYL